MKGFDSSHSLSALESPHHLSKHVIEVRSSQWKLMPTESLLKSHLVHFPLIFSALLPACGWRPSVEDMMCIQVHKQLKDLFFLVEIVFIPFNFRGVFKLVVLFECE